MLITLVTVTASSVNCVSLAIRTLMTAFSAPAKTETYSLPLGKSWMIQLWAFNVPQNLWKEDFIFPHTPSFLFLWHCAITWFDVSSTLSMVGSDATRSSRSFSELFCWNIAHFLTSVDASTEMTFVMGSLLGSAAMSYSLSWKQCRRTSRLYNMTQ